MSAEDDYPLIEALRAAVSADLRSEAQRVIAEIDRLRAEVDRLRAHICPGRRLAEVTVDEVLTSVDFERELVFGDNEAQVLVLAREVLRLRAEVEMWRNDLKDEFGY